MQYSLHTKRPLPIILTRVTFVLIVTIVRLGQEEGGREESQGNDLEVRTCHEFQGNDLEVRGSWFGIHTMKNRKWNNCPFLV